MFEFEFDMPIEVEAELEPQCRVMERLAKHRVREIWRQWNTTYPPAHQFSTVQGNLRNRRALEAYQEQDPRELFVLMIGPLAGWRCESEKPPILTDDVFVFVVVTPPDLSWAYNHYDFLYRHDAEARNQR
jgi:hypothetical protein